MEASPLHGPQAGVGGPALALSFANVTLVKLYVYVALHGRGGG